MQRISWMPGFYSIFGGEDHFSPKALCFAWSVAVMTPHLRGGGYWVGVRESVVDLQFSMYVLKLIKIAIDINLE